MRHKFAHVTIGIAAIALAGVAHGEDARPGTGEDSMRIRIVVEGAELTATLEDSTAARDFAAQLPLELTLEDYHGIEKIADLPSRLSTSGAPDGVDPEVGDITYFAPWGNLALFYRDFGYSRGLVRLGRIDGDIDVLAADGPLATRIERVEKEQ